MAKTKIEYFDTENEQEFLAIVEKMHQSEVVEANGCTYQYFFSDYLEIEIPSTVDEVSHVGFRAAFEKRLILSPERGVSGVLKRDIGRADNSKLVQLLETSASLLMSGDVMDDFVGAGEHCNHGPRKYAQLCVAGWKPTYKWS